MKTTTFITSLALALNYTLLTQPTTAATAPPMLKWTAQIGTSGYDQGASVSADSLGNVYITGWTNGSLSGPNAGSFDAFVALYDASGNLQWTEQLGTPASEHGFSISADSLSNVYLSGETYGSLGGTSPGSVTDAFLAKYDTSGSLQWASQLGTSNYDTSLGISVDPLGNVYLSGRTRGSLGGPNAGSYDAFLALFDDLGNHQWTRQLGSSETDSSTGVSVDSLGNVFISGYTDGDIAGSNLGSHDAFLAMYAVPEPTTSH
ncbi:MAG: SBBP repeat-containing protein [Pirellulales bacterium]